MQSSEKYSEVVADLLLEMGYSTVFFVAGGNIMHLIESFSHRFTMIPVMHEVNAVIAADYFNTAKNQDASKALALVTVGPGVTNTTTGIAGAFIDGREVLIIGGQVKSSDLKNGKQRQNGIQEVDGVSILQSITKAAVLLDKPLEPESLRKIIALSDAARPGPVYLEICLDVQGASIKKDETSIGWLASNHGDVTVNDYSTDFIDTIEKIKKSKRPLFLLGGGVPRDLSTSLLRSFEQIGIPVATTWGGVDRIHSSHKLYAGRPNTFGQRWANVLLQQADLLIVLGSSLGLQQTGFNTREFLPLGEIVQLDIDPTVLQSLKHPRKKTICIDLKTYLHQFLEKIIEESINIKIWNEWIDFKNFLKQQLPLVEEETFKTGSINPFQFIYELSANTSCDHAIVTCSSGGTYTSFMQTFQNQENQIVISSKGLGSMGIGPGGAIGTQIATNKKTILFDGDGGFIQNSQELGVISARNLPIKVFVFSNDGYGSIRTTQKKYFGGNYVGCDAGTGLGFPNLELYAASFGIRYHRQSGDDDLSSIIQIINDENPWLVELNVDPKQEYIPKINSRITPEGSMESNPLHQMWPELSSELSSVVFRYLLSDRATNK
jgi:acetolactate synthase-1/2/3 large subunit